MGRVLGEMGVQGRDSFSHGFLHWCVLMHIISSLHYTIHSIPVSKSTLPSLPILPRYMKHGRLGPKCGLELEA